MEIAYDFLIHINCCCFSIRIKKSLVKERAQSIGNSIPVSDPMKQKAFTVAKKKDFSNQWTKQPSESSGSPPLHPQTDRSSSSPIPMSRYPPLHSPTLTFKSIIITIIIIIIIKHNLTYRERVVSAEAQTPTNEAKITVLLQTFIKFLSSSFKSGIYYHFLLLFINYHKKN